MRGGHIGDETQKLDVASACSMSRGEGLLPTLVKVNEALLIGNEDENKSLLRPFQATCHGCCFNLTPIGHACANDEPGDPSVIVNDVKIPF